MLKKLLIVLFLFFSVSCDALFVEFNLINETEIPWRMKGISLRNGTVVKEEYESQEISGEILKGLIFKQAKFILEFPEDSFFPLRKEYFIPSQQWKFFSPITESDFLENIEKLKGEDFRREPSNFIYLESIEENREELTIGFTNIKEKQEKTNLINPSFFSFVFSLKNPLRNLSIKTHTHPYYSYFILNEKEFESSVKSNICILKKISSDRL